MSQVALKGLYSVDYEHPFDRKALNLLEGTPGFEFLSRKFIQLGAEKFMQIQLTGSHLKVTRKNFPDLKATFEKVCQILDMQKEPDLYLKVGFGINAFATGADNPIIVLHSNTVDLLEEEELMFIIGHELGHVKSNHVLYHHMGEVLQELGGAIGSVTLGVGQLVTSGLQIALLNWRRMSEFTADRAGLLACQNVNSAAKAMLKLAGLPKKYYNQDVVGEFLDQAKSFQDLNYDKLNKVVKLYFTASMTHPWTVLRCAEFYKWIESGQYAQILSMTENKRAVAINTNAHNCPNCGFDVHSQQSFCGGCGKQLLFE